MRALVPAAWILAASVIPAQEAAPAAEATPAPPKADAPAALYSARCAGCHTIGGGARTGPDLLPVAARSPEELTPAVKRMEKNSGPMSEAEVAALVEFLRDSKARERLADEQARRMMVSAAALEPASPAAGKALFHGTRRLSGGGPACSACHAVSGVGGTLAVDLTAVHARFGGAGLAPAIQGAAFPVMKPIYAAHPITAQESAHIAAFLAGAGAAPPEPAPFPAAVAGAIAAAAIFAGLAIAGIRRRPGTRARLVAEANRS